MMLEKRWQWFVVLLLCVLGARVASGQFYGSGTTSNLGGFVYSVTVSGSAGNVSGIAVSGTYTGDPAVQGSYAFFSGSGSSSIIYRNGVGTYPRVWYVNGSQCSFRITSGGSTYTVAGSFSLTPPPTPTPSPTPPAEGEAEIEGFESIDWIMKVDTDGDGVPDTIIASGTLQDGDTWTGEVPEGVAYEVIATQGYTIVEGGGGGQAVPINQVIASGGGPGPPAATSPVAASQSPPIQYVTVGTDGAVSTGGVLIHQTATVEGPKTVYTYANSSGGATSVIYSGSGVEFTKAADIREASAQNSAENERILTALNAVAQKIDIANSGTAGIPLVSMPSNPDPADQLTIPSYADAVEKAEAVALLASDAVDALGTISTGLRNGSGYPSFPVLSSSYGSALSWNITLPVLGSANVDLNAHAAYINAFREFVKFVLATVAAVIMVKLIRGAFV